MHQQSTGIHAMSYRLWRQALSGDSGAALVALEQMDLGELSILAADLLARLYIRGRPIPVAFLAAGSVQRIEPC